MLLTLPPRAKSSATIQTAARPSPAATKTGIVQDYPGADYLAREMANWMNTVADDPSARNIAGAEAYLSGMRTFVEQLLQMDVSGEIASLEATIENTQTALAQYTNSGE